MSDQAQKFIKNKKKQKLRKKMIIIIFLFIGMILGIVFKAPFLNLETVTLSGNIVLDKKNIFNEKEIIGQNIFLYDQKALEDSILNNSYIEGVSIKKQLPNILNIKVEERKMLYKIKDGKNYYILNKSLAIMEIKNDISGLSLVELKGVKLDNKDIGKTITKDENKIKVAEILGDNNILNKDNSIDNIEIDNINNIILNKDKLKIILGDIENLEEKYNKAMDILNSNTINIKSGYIDVSFKGNPVIKTDEIK